VALLALRAARTKNGGCALRAQSRGMCASRTRRKDAASRRRMAALRPPSTRASARATCSPAQAN